MCDNFKGWGNFSLNEFGIHSNVCLPHGTGIVSNLILSSFVSLMAGTAGIAVEKYSHVKYFQNRAAYDDYYEIVVDIGEIGVEKLAATVQGLLVDYLRTKYGNSVADWYQEFWAGERGRMCLAHSMYAGCNNNMGVQVSWRLIKAICSGLAALAQFLCALCTFIRSQLGEEHRCRLRIAGHPNAFIREPKATKEMYDAVQDMHPKTLSTCWILATSTTKTNPELKFRDMVHWVSDSVPRNAPLHRRILAYHGDRIRAKEALPLELLDLNTVLMPRQ